MAGSYWRGGKRPGLNFWDQRRANDLHMRHLAESTEKGRDALKAGELPLNNLPPKRTRKAGGERGASDKVKREIIPTESQEQRAVIAWWSNVCEQYRMPPYALFAIPNGGARDHVTGAILKGEGVRAGTPDLMLAVPRGWAHGLFIEMKRRDARPSDTSEAQQYFIAFLRARNYRVEVCKGADEATRLIATYLNGG